MAKIQLNILFVVSFRALRHGARYSADVLSRANVLIVARSDVEQAIQRAHIAAKYE